MQVTDSFTAINDLEIHLIRAGEGDPLLYLHGAGGNISLMPFQQSLAEYFELWIPEHPGFGYSQKSSSIETMEDMLFFYLDFIRSTGLRSFHLMGQSLGGWIAAEMAVILGDGMLKSLTLIDAAGIWLPEKPMADIFVVGDADLPSFLAYEAVQPPPQTEEQISLALQNRYRLAQLAWDPYLHNPSLRKRLYRIQTPTLIVWGENDPLIPVDYAHAWQQSIAGAELSVIPRCGHTPTKERPDEFVAAVLSFHKKLNASASRQGGVME